MANRFTTIPEAVMGLTHRRPCMTEVSRRTDRRVRTFLVTLSMTIILTTADTALARSPVPWTILTSTVFRILADAPGWPVNCTGWYGEPRSYAGAAAVSVYVTAGHCAVPQLAKTVDGLEQMAVLARIVSSGVDAAVGDPESPERRDIERVTDVRESVQAVKPPDGKGRGGDRQADRQDERDPRQLAEPFAQHLERLR